MKLKWL